MDNDNMIKTNSIVMINEQMNKRNKISGRVYFDYVVLTIHKNTDEFQDNHICWLEEYVKNNLESAQNMPIVAQFVDCEKSEPLGHGFPGEKNGKPVIYDSVYVSTSAEKLVEAGKQFNPSMYPFKTTINVDDKGFYEFN